MTDWTIYGAPILGRKCGSCHFCCVFVPFETFGKPAGVRCPALYHKGCRIYATRPEVCRAWSCAWLYQPETAGMHRPDLAGYCIDPMPADFLADGEPRKAVQVWVDPARPDSHRDPALRSYLAGVAERTQMPALVTLAVPDQTESTFLTAPCLSWGSEWMERTFPLVSEKALAEKMAAAIERRVALTRS